jgi:hypothetical protein
VFSEVCLAWGHLDFLISFQLTTFSTGGHPTVTPLAGTVWIACLRARAFDRVGHLAGELVFDVQFLGGGVRRATMTPRVHECFEKARDCDSLAMQAKDPLVKAALQEAARHWRERAQRLEQQFIAEGDRRPTRL